MAKPCSASTSNPIATIADTALETGVIIKAPLLNPANAEKEIGGDRA
jgi:hypothetical protein